MNVLHNCVTCPSSILDAAAAEIDVLRVIFASEGRCHQAYNMHARDAAIGGKLTHFPGRYDVGRQFHDKLANNVTQLVQLFQARNVTGDVARILKILLASKNLCHCVRFRPVRRPQVNGEHDTATPGIIVEDRLDRRVGENTPVPIEFITYPDGWEAWRQSPGGHNVPDRQFCITTIEITLGRFGDAAVRCSDEPDRSAPQAYVRAAWLNSSRRDRSQAELPSREMPKGSARRNR
jgi:hypothetical protein